MRTGQERNQAFLDSIKVVAGDNYVPMDLEKLDKVEVGEMFYVKNEFVSTLQTPEYIYCKKLVKNLDGQRPMATEDGLCLLLWYTDYWY